MDPQIAQMHCTLSGKKDQARADKSKLEALRDAILNHLPRFTPLQELKDGEVSVLAMQFDSGLVDYKALLGEIKAIEEALGK